MAPCHSSLLKTLWVVYGPEQLDKKAGELMHKIEHRGFAELSETCVNRGMTSAPAAAPRDR
eukprot:scaffold50136_cov64-Phaeocystis_antarctica.AAC.8